MSFLLGPAKCSAGPLLFTVTNPVRSYAGISAAVIAWVVPPDGDGGQGRRVYHDTIRLDKPQEIRRYSQAVLAACAEKTIALPDQFTVPGGGAADGSTQTLTPEEAIVEALGDLYAGLDAGEAAPPPLDVTVDEISANRRYAVIDGCLYKVEVDDDDKIHKRTLLMSGAAKITADIHLDDGDGEIERRVRVAVTVHGQTYHLTLPIREAQGEGLAGTLLSAAGPGLLIEPGVERRLYHAIASFGTPPVQEVRSHTGWLRDRAGAWHYLDGLGDVLAIDREGENAPWSVALPDEPILARYRLRRGLDPLKGWEALRRVLETGAHSVTYPAVAAGVLPLIHPFLGTATRVMPFLLGQTGRWKTALARLVCQLYGHFDDEGDLLSWASTYASWETHSHTLKDMLLILDDFKRGTTDPRQVTKFIQHYSDSTGRQRRRSDLSALPSKRVRCIVLATGEDAPQLQPSVAARLLYIPVGPGALAPAKLTPAQETAGDLHGFTTDFVAWLAGAHDVQSRLGADFRPRRKAAMDELGVGTNVGRVAENVVMLSLAWETLGAYVRARGWLGSAEWGTLDSEGLQAILALGTQQLRLIDSQSPDRIFLDTLQGLVYSGEVSLHTKNGLPSGKGPVVGYSDGECIALYSGQSEGGTGLVAFHKVVEHLARANQRFEHDWASVGEYLKTNGWLLKHDKKHLTTTKSISGSVRRVLLLRPEALIVPTREEETQL